MKSNKSNARSTICANCEHWAEDKAPASKASRERMGECKRFPPQAVAAGEDSAVFIWPTTAYDDRCGEYKAKCDA